MLENLALLLGTACIFLGVFWLVDRILFGLFGCRWRMPKEYESKKEKTQPPTFGS